MSFWSSWTRVVDFFERDVPSAADTVVRGAGAAVDQVAGGAVTAYDASWGGLDYAVDWSKTSAAATSSWVTSVAGDAADFSVDSYTSARGWCVGAWGTLQGLLMGSPPRLGPPNPLARQCMGILLGAGLSDAVVSAWEKDARAKGYTMAFNLRATLSFGAGATAVSGIYVDNTGAWGFFAEAGAGVGLPLPDASVGVEVWMVFAGREAFADKYFMPGLTLKIPLTPGSAPGVGVGEHESPQSGPSLNLGGNVLLSQNFSFRGFRVLQGLSLVKIEKASLSPGSGPMSTNLAAVRLAQEGPSFDAAVRVQQQPANEQAIMVTAMAGKVMIRDVEALLRFDFVRLRSWKGDCLHRPDSPSGVTTWHSGVGNVWRPERAPGGGFLLKSWKGDYLHRPDSPQGVTTWTATGGSRWTLEQSGERMALRSWKGDYLHRPDSPQGVTTWAKGGGSDWILEGLPGRQPAPVLGRQFLSNTALNLRLGARPDRSVYGHANRLEWEIWRVEDAGDGLVYLVSAHGLQLGATPDGRVYTHTNRDAWERWRFVEGPNNTTLIRSAHGQHLGVRPDGSVYTHSNSAEWEQWARERCSP
ncbi:MAG: hypothetical protein IPK80_19170 [Nannocystis sp.]|nr:hypothetical protein [Nannocystis sp.]